MSKLKISLFTVLLAWSSGALAAATLLNNIRGYQFIEGSVPENLPAERVTLKPRPGYWREFGAMKIDSDGRIEKIYTQSIAAKELGDQADLQVIDGQGRFVLPGIIDAHGHLLSLGQRLQRVDLVATTSVGEVQQRLQKFIERQPERDWILGRGWNQVLWPEKVFPNAGSLDEIESQKPVYLTRIDGHAAWANSAALKAAGINALSKSPQGGQIIRNQAGEPTGVLVDNAMNLMEKVIPPADKASILQALKFAQHELKALGITSMHDAGANTRLINIYRELHKKNALTLRIYAMIEDADEHLSAAGEPWTDHDKDMLSVRSVKLYADGALGSRGAALLEEYTDQPKHKGLLFSPYDELRLKVERANEMGFQVNVHAIGDAANRQVLDIFAELPDSSRKLRHRIEHSQVIALEDLSRFKTLDVIASMQPTHASSDMNMAEDRLGPDRILGAYAWRRLLDSGAIIAAGSDFPVELSNPYHGLYAALSRKDRNGDPAGGWYADQALNRAEALRAFTIDAAYAAHQETELGNLKEGMWADFIVLDENYFELQESKLHAMLPLQTWLAGNCIYERETKASPNH